MNTTEYNKLLAKFLGAVCCNDPKTPHWDMYGIIPTIKDGVDTFEFWIPEAQEHPLGYLNVAEINVEITKLINLQKFIPR